MSDELPDREPLSERELQRVTLEIAVGVIVWVAAVFWLGSKYLELPDWANYGAALCGGLGIALVIGWWRIIRHGPEGPARRVARKAASSSETESSNPLASGYLFSAFGALFMSVLLLTDGEERQRIWAGVFVVLAVGLYVRYLKERDR